MGIHDDIAAARQSGVSDNDIINAYSTYDPSKADDIKSAMAAGYTSGELLDSLPGGSNAGQGVIGGAWAMQPTLLPEAGGPSGDFAGHLANTLGDGGSGNSNPAAGAVPIDGPPLKWLPMMDLPTPPPSAPVQMRTAPTYDGSGAPTQQPQQQATDGQGGNDDARALARQALVRQAAIGGDPIAGQLASAMAAGASGGMEMPSAPPQAPAFSGGDYDIGNSINLQNAMKQQHMARVASLLVRNKARGASSQ